MGIARKLQHLSLSPATWSVERLKKFFEFFARYGGTGILLDYKTAFPYTGTLKNLRAANAYTEQEIGELCAHAEKLGLEIIPKGISFSHAEAILKCPEFADLADGKALTAEILGELQSYYLRVAGWDTMLHTVNGFLCAAVGFALVDIFNRNQRFTFALSPMFMAVVAFCFSMTIGVLWEFFEYAGDQLLHMDMQKDTVVHAISSVMLNPSGENVAVTISGIEDVAVNGVPLGLGGYLDIGLHDTMKDLFVNLIGAVVFSVIGYFYVKNRGRGRFARQFIPIVPETGAAAEATAPEADPEATKAETGETARGA